MPRMPRHRSFSLIGTLLLAWIASHGLVTSAQTPATSPAPDDAVRLVGAGLINPRGLTVAPDGRVLVGSGGTGGDSGTLVEVSDGCPTVVVDGIRSYRIVFGASVSVADVAVREGTTYLLVAGGDIDGGAMVNGLYRLLADGELELVADISAFIRDNPVAERPPDYDTDGQPYHMAPIDGGFLVTEGNSNQLLRVRLDGRISRVADLSAGHPIPTGLTIGPDGAIYVGTFTAAPYPEVGAQVLRITADGQAEPVWTDLTMIAALTTGPDGRLYALETATGHGAEADDLDPASGRVVELLPDGSWSPVVTGLPLPMDVAFGPDGRLIIDGPAFGADDGSGIVLSVALPSTGTVDASSPGPAPRCE